MITVFRGDSSRFDLRSEEVETQLKPMVFADALPQINRSGHSQTELQWDTPQSEHGFQRVALTGGAVVVEGDHPYVAQLVIAIRRLFAPDASDVWVGNTGQGLGRLLGNDDTAADVFEGWAELPIDQFR